MITCLARIYPRAPYGLLPVTSPELAARVGPRNPQRSSRNHNSVQFQTLLSKFRAFRGNFISLGNESLGAMKSKLQSRSATRAWLLYCWRSRAEAAPSFSGTLPYFCFVIPSRYNSAGPQFPRKTPSESVTKADPKPESHQWLLTIHAGIRILRNAKFNVALRNPPNLSPFGKTDSRLAPRRLHSQDHGALARNGNGNVFGSFGSNIDVPRPT
jgi:hypothetical protein